MAISVSTVLFALCMWYVFATYEWEKLFGVILQVDLLLLLLGAGFAILFYGLLRSLRWWIMLRSLDISVDFHHVYVATFLSLSIALLTPLMAGEVLKVELLKRQGILGRMPGYSTLALEKVLDTLTLLSMTLIGIPVLFVSDFSPQYALFIFILLIILALLGRLIVGHIRLPGRLGVFVSQIRDVLYGTNHFYAVLVLTIASWLVVVLGWMFCLTSISINIDYLQTMGFMGLVTFASILSMVPGAIGVSEAS